MNHVLYSLLVSMLSMVAAQAQPAVALPDVDPAPPWGAPAPAATIYENLDLLPANKLIPAEFRQGPGFVVEDPVATDGYFGIYLLRTHQGIFECHGKEMLAIRIDELRAIQELEAVNKGDAFLKAAGGAIAKPLEATARIVRDPGGSLEKVPHGVANLFKRAGEGVQAVGGAMAKGAENVRRNLDGEAPLPDAVAPPSRQDPFGFNKNRNQWAAQVKVDPYSSNPLLAQKLDEISAVTFTTNLVAGIGLGAVAAPLAWVGRVDEYVLTEPPAKIKERVAAELLALNCQKTTVDGFLANRWFTPTQQLRFSRALGRLSGAANLNAAVELAAVTEGEVQVRFLCASLESLGSKKLAPDDYKSMVVISPVPGMVRQDGSLLVAAPLDVLPWIATTEAFAGRAAEFPKRTLLAPTQITTRARESLTAMGWTVE